jgi:hypothetical protein
MTKAETKELKQLCHDFSALIEPNKQMVVDISRVLLGSQKNYDNAIARTLPKPENCFNTPLGDGRAPQKMKRP